LIVGMLEATTAAAGPATATMNHGRLIRSPMAPVNTVHALCSYSLAVVSMVSPEPEWGPPPRSYMPETRFG
jgi:hypothetical protein